MIRAAIRLRGDINIKPGIKVTLAMLRLNKVNHCVLLPTNPINDGMLRKVKDYVTWGEIKPDVLVRMIVTRGKLAGNRPIDIKYVKELTKHDSLVKFANAVAEEKEPYTSLKNVKPVFRLHPPLRGHEGVKRSFKAGGALGYRGEAINDLILKMLGPKPEEKKPKKKAEPKKPVAAKAAKKAKKPEKPEEKKPAAKKTTKKADKPKESEEKKPVAKKITKKAEKPKKPEEKKPAAKEKSAPKRKVVK